MSTAAAAAKKKKKRKKKAFLRLTVRDNKYKHVPRDGYIKAEAVGDIYLPSTTTQAELRVRGVAVVIDMRDKVDTAGPYTPAAMSAQVVGTYVVTGFYDPVGTVSRQSRRTIIVLDGHITHATAERTAYYALEPGTKILTVC